MKRIGLLLVSTMLLSGCTSTNGILSKKDLMNESIEGNYEAIESMLEEQKNIAYIPDDIKDFVSKTKTDNISESGRNYLNISLQDINNTDRESFIHNVYYGGIIDKDAKAEFEELVSILDETISKGIKLYLDKNIEADIKEDGTYTKIGKVWICIAPLNKDEYGYDIDSESEFIKNEVRLMIKVKDVKDEKYKKMLDSLIGEDLMVDSINVGKHQDLIQLSNMEAKLYDEYKNGLESPVVKYQLFMKDKEVNKARVFISSMANKEINDNLASLTRLSDTFEFNLEDMKQLEEMKMIIKGNKKGKKSLSSENFNFSYRNFENERYIYGLPEKVSITELVIEKRK